MFGISSLWKSSVLMCFPWVFQSNAQNCYTTIWVRTGKEKYQGCLFVCCLWLFPVACSFKEVSNRASCKSFELFASFFLRTSNLDNQEKSLLCPLAVFSQNQRIECDAVFAMVIVCLFFIVHFFPFAWVLFEWLIPFVFFASFHHFFSLPLLHLSRGVRVCVFDVLCVALCWY